MSIELAAGLKTITAVGAAFVVLWGGIQVADTRYEMKAVHEPEHELIETGMESLNVTTLKKEIREIRALLRTVTDPGYRTELQNDLDDAIDRLCDIKPTDRECSH